MRRAPSPVAISPVGPSAVGTLPWRRGDRWFVTIVVKGSYALARGGQAMPVEPDPIAPGAPNEVGELAPILGQADILLTGSLAPMAHASVQPPFRIGLGVARDGVWAMNKTIAIAERRVAGLGPETGRIPATIFASSASPAALEIPDPFDWTLFQAAPRDQRIEHLCGREWIALAGAFPGSAVFMTQLPGAVAQALLFADTPTLRRGAPVALACDTLHVDIDRQRCSVLWRGSFPVSGPEAFAALHVVAGIELPGNPIAWFDPLAARGAAPAASAPGVGWHESTAPLSPAALADLRGRAVLPFTPAAPPEAAPRKDEVWYEKTAAVDEMRLAMLAVRGAMPFQGAAPPPAPAPLPPMAPPFATAPPVVEIAVPPPPARMGPVPPPVAEPPPPPPAPTEPAGAGESFLAALPEEEERLSPTQRLAARAAKARRKPKEGG